MANVFPTRLIESVNGQTGVVTVNEDKYYIYTQASPTNNWTINHGLGKYPAVTVLDDNKNELETKVTHNNENQVTITSNTPFTGYAIFN